MWTPFSGNVKLFDGKRRYVSYISILMLKHMAIFFTMPSILVPLSPTSHLTQGYQRRSLIRIQRFYGKLALRVALNNLPSTKPPIWKYLSNNFLHPTGVPLRSTPAGEKYDRADRSLLLARPSAIRRRLISQPVICML